ncbi:hypothetical protein L1049_027973 [Liquidambar formosana]|uniref:Tetraspanin-8 n=1 Tax=Liquidambar formosana TaxID=63359 RepID=A0AAP0WVY9_LIQFO
MFRVSNIVIGILNFFTLILSIASLGGSVWFHFQGETECQRVLQNPLLVLGVFLFVVSLLGLFGSWCRVTVLMWLYLFVMFFFILGLICFTVFAIVITNKGVGKAISERGFKEYRLGDYSHWLQKYVVNEGNWVEIQSCLVDAKVCRSLGNGGVHQKASDFYLTHLSPTQSGCCKPPTYCGFEFKNATYWTVPKSGPAVPDTDCTTWSNDQSKLCYDCKSCKGGVLANIKNEWRSLTILNVCIILFLIIVYTTGCCAYRNNREDNKYNRYKGHP